MNTKAMHEVVRKTQEGKMTFPQVVVALMHEGVESYFVDFAAGRETFYLAGGGTHAEPMILKVDAIAEEFSDSGLVAAIRGAQADTIRYPEFVKRSTATPTFSRVSFSWRRRWYANTSFATANSSLGWSGAASKK